MFKSGSLSEWYYNKTYKSISSDKNNENESIEKDTKKIIKLKIIFSQQNENEKETDIEIYNTESIENLIKKFCIIKKISNKNLYITKKDLKKIKNDKTINQAKISNNETMFIFEKKEKEKNSDNKEINFNINYLGENFTFKCSKDDIFSECIKSFIEKKGEKKNFLYIFNGNIIDKNKSLDNLEIKNGSVVRIGELK